MFLVLIKLVLHHVYMVIIGGRQIIIEQILDRHRPIKDDILSLDGTGKTIVITGGNRGIGWEAVKFMLPLGYHIIFGARNPPKLDQDLQKLKASGKMGCGTYEIFDLNLKSLKSVEAFAKKISDKYAAINVLVNNAGIMFGDREETEDGYESQFAVNHLSHFLLSHLLLNKIKSAGTGDNHARIVNVSSCAQHNGAYIDFDDLQSKKFYSPEMAYGNSKIAQIMFTKYLDKHLLSHDDCHVTVTAIHPGVVRTDLHKSAFMHTVGALCMKTPKQGGDSIIFAALSPKMEGRSGLYLDNGQPTKVAKLCLNPENLKRMWNVCIEMLGIKTFGDGKVDLK